MADDLPTPLTRAEQQARTRAALIASARRVFARDGYHGANLAAIAREAGLTKGAVYSNFENKADVFLAVLDDDLTGFEPGSWDPLTRFESFPDLGDEGVRSARLSDDERDAVGFGLATVEFATVTARDPKLSTALSQRLGLLRAGYEAMARRERRDDDPLSDDQLGTMLMALDQGTSIMWLFGQIGIDAATIRSVMLRMLRPGNEG